MRITAEALLQKPQPILVVAGVLTALCVSAGAAMDLIWLSVAPLALLFGLVLIYDYRAAYYLMILSIPFSIEIALPGGFTTDLPSEPLMLVVMGCFLISAPLNRPLEWDFLRHPICLIIGAMLLWSVIGILYTVDTLKSVKYVLAKTWYLVSFLLFTGSILRSLKDLKRILWFFMVPLVIVACTAMVKHAGFRFSFEKANFVVAPFFMNHVLYAATLALFVPYVCWLWLQAKGQPILRLIFTGVILLLLVAIGLSYTRASWLSIPIAIIYLLVLRLKLTKIMLAAMVIAVSIAAGYLTYNNNFLKYAPEYEATVFNEGNISRHLEATYKLEDVSGMERIYRWIAAVRMAYANPVTGTGPNTFYPEYKSYTISSFETYVSDNPEKSTTHNYFLYVLAEQGFAGLILLVSLVFYALILAQRLYSQAIDKHLKQTVICATLSLVIILFHLLLNELIEVDKIGSFFYISLAVLIRIDLWQKAHRELLEPAR